MMMRHEWEVEEGEDEEAWENIVMEELKKSGGPRKEWLRKEGKDWANGDRGWVVEPIKAKERVKYLLWDDLNRTKQLGGRMIEVVDKEKELWRQERNWRKHARNDARRERKRASGDGERKECPGGGKEGNTPHYITYKPQ
jgi:hypothetical protein